MPPTIDNLPPAVRGRYRLRPHLLVAGVATTALLASEFVPTANAGPDSTAAPAPTSAAPQAAVTRPNIVLVLTDDLETSLLRFMSNVAKLGAHGATFNRFTVSDTLCCPSRASILTGRYPHNTKIFTKTAPDGRGTSERSPGTAMPSTTTRSTRTGARSRTVISPATT